MDCWEICTWTRSEACSVRSRLQYYCLAPSPSVTVTVHSKSVIPNKDTVAKSSVCHPKFARREILPRVGFDRRFTVGIDTTTEHVNIISKWKIREIETEDLRDRVQISTDASSQLPSTYPSFGVTRTDVCNSAVSVDGSVLQ